MDAKRTRLLTFSFLALGLVACSKGREVQIGTFKAEMPSVGEAQESAWDFFLQPSKRLSSELLLASKAGNKKLVKELLGLRHDRDILLSMETKDEKGWTPLLWAAHYNDAEIVEELLDAGANADARSDDGVTALALAVRNNNEVMLRTLLKHCNVVDTPDQQGMTPLMLAVSNNNLDFVEELVRKKAKPYLRNAKGKSAAQMAEELGNWRAVKLIMGNFEWNNIVTAEDGSIYYLSPQTVRRLDGESMLAWLKYSEPPAGADKGTPAPEKKKEVAAEPAYTLMQVEVQCREQHIRHLRGTYVSSAGKQEAVKLSNSSEPVLPETVGDAIVEEVCEAVL